MNSERKLANLFLLLCSFAARVRIETTCNKTSTIKTTSFPFSCSPLASSLLNNGHFTVMNESEADGDLVLSETFSALLWKLFLKNTSKHKNNLIYIIKQEGLYQNKVTISLASIHSCKMAYCLPCSRLMPTLLISHHRTFRQFFSLVHVVTLSWSRELQLVPYSNTRKKDAGILNAHKNRLRSIRLQFRSGVPFNIQSLQSIVLLSSGILLGPNLPIPGLSAAREIFGRGMPLSHLKVFPRCSWT